MAKPTKIVINCDIEQARKSREWQASKAAKKATRKEKQAAIHEKQLLEAIANGVKVQTAKDNKPRKFPVSAKDQEIAALKAEIARLKGFKVAPAYKPGMKGEFYQAREWRELRWKVLTASNGRCVTCNRGKQDGVIIHIDHIKPRSKFPALELIFENLQVLCEDCNIGKSNN